MAFVDSFRILFSQVQSDIRSLSTTITNVFAIVGACYALKLSLGAFGSSFKNLSSILQIFQSKNLVKTYGRWAIVTGPTSGIGKAFAMQLGSKGLNIVLVGRDHQKLDELSKVIETNYGVNVIIIEIDFNEFDEISWQKLYDLCLNMEVGILINNAGIHYKYPMPFHQVDYSRISSLSQVNIVSTVKILHAVIPGMVGRKRGLIVNVSSSAGMMHSPLISLYSSSKTFVDHLSQSLYYEMQPHNVHVQSLVPMYVSTRMTSYSKLLTTFSPSADVYVKHAIRTFGKYRSNTGYLPHTWQTWMLKKLPENVAVWIGHKFQQSLYEEGLQQEKQS